MTQIATVEARLRPGVVRVVVRRETACGHDCEHCGGCAAGAGQFLRVEAADALNTAPGDQVVVESATAPVLKAAAAVYLLPMATLLAGYAVGTQLSGAAVPAATVLGFLLGLLPAVLLDRRTRRRGGTAFRVLEKL